MEKAVAEHNCEEMQNEQKCPYCKDELFCKACDPCLAKALARIAVLEKCIFDANEVLFDAAPLDVEHAISYHADTLAYQFRRTANAADKALEILQVIVAEKVGG